MNLVNINNNDIAVFAKTNFRGEGRIFGIKTDDRRRHMYIIGKTGMGKSVLLENLVISDIIKGKGVAVVDPHGDLVEKIIKCIPNNRINDVIYLNPADLDYPISFNVLEKVDPKYRHLIASGMVGVFKKLWAESWGPRLEYLLRNAILALLDYPDSTLLGVNRILIDKDYRKKVVAKVKDPVVKSFWNDEFTKYNQSFMVEAIAPIQNKVGQFLSTALIRNIVGQVKSSIDLRKVMDEGKILLLNLSKGRIGEDASAMLGAMLITKIQLAAMSRVDIPENERRDFYLYVDEFQNFSTESFANILSEARKYHLNLIVAHQYIKQLDEKVAAAIFGNVGTLIVFRVGAADAEVLAKEFSPNFTEEDFVNLPKYHIYLKLMIDGVASDPFSAITLPPIAKETGNMETVIRVSRERYGKPREVVEEKIARWSGVETEEMLEKLEKQLEEKQISPVIEKNIDFLASFQGKNKNEPEPVTVLSKKENDKEGSVQQVNDKFEVEFFVVKCNSCGAKTKINFKPDGVRPVFCKECLKEYRRQQAKAENLARERKTFAQKNRLPPPPGMDKPKPVLDSSQALSLKQALSRKPQKFNVPKKKDNLNEDIANSHLQIAQNN